MWSLLDGPERLIRAMPAHLLLLCLVGVIATDLFFLYILLYLVAPKPRPVLPSERTYLSSSPDGETPVRKALPCWHDRWLAERSLPATAGTVTGTGSSIDTTSASSAAGDIDSVSALGIPSHFAIEPASVALSVVVPAYNEELRIVPALEEAVAYLDANFLSAASPASALSRIQAVRRRGAAAAAQPVPPGYEIVVVDDGSSDGTQRATLDFARRRGLHDKLRYVRLERNRGKGGAVTHGLRHVRGEYVLFADADGASRFSDVARLVEGCEEVADGSHRGVAIGSRAHLVGSDAVVKRSLLRNFLMRGFHFVLTILTPPATSRLRDTQCGFKLFTRAALPHIVPFMHAEGWIFDIEMLMLAESAPAVPVLGSDGRAIGATPGIRVAEVPVDWREIPGSKLNVVDASVRMAVGLAVLRASWMMGVYRRRVA